MTHHTASLIRAQAYLSVMDGTIKRPLNRFIIANAGRSENSDVIRRKPRKALKFGAAARDRQD